MWPVCLAAALAAAAAGLLAGGPQLLGRVAVTLLLALGAGSVVGGIAAVRRFREVRVPETASAASS